MLSANYQMSQGQMGELPINASNPVWVATSQKGNSMVDGLKSFKFF